MPYEEGLAQADEARRFFTDLWASGARRRLPPGWTAIVAAGLAVAAVGVPLGIALRNTWVSAISLAVALLPLVIALRGVGLMQRNAARDMHVWSAPGWVPGETIPGVTDRKGADWETAYVTYRLGGRPAVGVGLDWLALPKSMRLERQGPSLVASKDGRPVAAVVFRTATGPRPRGR